MNLSFSERTSRAMRLILLIGLGWGVFLLTGCQTLREGELAAIEYQAFTPKDPASRLMNEVKMRWEVRDDVSAYCAKTIGMSHLQAKTTPPVACAIWHVATKQCTIVTGPSTSHVVIGHEVRHCFEGAFPH